MQAKSNRKLLDGRPRYRNGERGRCRAGRILKEMDGGEKEVIKNMGENRVIISLTEDELLDTIANFKALKPMMQNIVRKANGSDTKQGTKDAVELGHDFDVAIEAMTMLVVNIQKGE